MKVLRLMILLMTVSAAGAQVPGMFPWWEAPIRKDIGLSDEQNKQISATLSEMRPRMIQLRIAVENAEAGLKDEMDAVQVDPRKVNEAIEGVVAARAELMRAVAQMSLKLRLALSAAQWQELQKYQSRGGGRRMPQRGLGMNGPILRKPPPGQTPPNNF